MIQLIDSNIYIRGFRDSAFGETLRQFHQKHLPHLVLSAVVAHELLVGAANPVKERSLRRGLIEPFRTRQRLHVPRRETWEMAAKIDVRLRKRLNLEPKLRTRGFANDMLIAATARELGAIILTENSADFSIIASVLDIRFTHPQDVFLMSWRAVLLASAGCHGGARLALSSILRT